MTKTVELIIGNAVVKIVYENDEIDWASIGDEELSAQDFLELVEALQEFIPKPAKVDTPWQPNPYAPGVGPLKIWNGTDTNPRDAAARVEKAIKQTYSGSLDDNSKWNGDQ